MFDEREKVISRGKKRKFVSPTFDRKIKRLPHPSTQEGEKRGGIRT